MTNDDMLRKIQGLLAKADGTDNEHERDAFYAKAQALMLKHAIDEAMLAAAGNGQEDDRTPIVEAFTFSADDRFRPGKMSLLHGIAETNRVRAVFHRATKKNQQSSLVGFKSDIEFVKLLYTSALMQAMGASNKAWKQSAGSGSRHTFTSNFIYGFAGTVTRRLDEAARQAKADAGVTEGTSTALALIDRDQQISDKFAEAFPRVGTARGSLSRNGDARLAGAAAGRNADLSAGRNNIGNKTRALR